MIRAFVLYEGDLDPERYQRHLEEFTSPINATFRHGKVFGAAMGDPKFTYYAEFEFPDKDAFKKIVGSDEFAAAGKDAMDMGVPFTVHFADITEQE